MTKTDLATRKRLEKLSQLIKGKNVLDIGCRDSVLKDYLRPEVNYCGLEIGRPAKNKNTFYLRKGILDQKIKTLFEKKKFDTIILAETLEHLPDPVAALNNIKHLLAKNGQLIGSVPNAVAWRYFFFLEYFGQTDQCEDGDKGHLFGFDKLILKNLLKSCGFKIKMISEWGNWIPHTRFFFPFNTRGAHLIFVAEI